MLKFAARSTATGGTCWHIMIIFSVTTSGSRDRANDEVSRLKKANYGVSGNWITIAYDDLSKLLSGSTLTKGDWWDEVSEQDRKAIEEGLEQLDRGEYMTRLELREKIQEKYKR